jgi:hypothetical protein
MFQMFAGSTGGEIFGNKNCLPRCVDLKTQTDRANEQDCSTKKRLPVPIGGSRIALHSTE